MYEVISIRNTENLGEFPLLPLIAEGVDYVFRMLESGESAVIDENEFSMGMRDVLGLTSEVYSQEGEEAYQHARAIHAATSRRCLYAGRKLKDYLIERSAEERLDTSIYSLDSSGCQLKYFGQHSVVLVIDNITGQAYGVSPANAFNQDGSIPILNGVGFDRLTSVIFGDTAEDVIRGIYELENLEGSDDRWKIYDNEGSIVQRINTISTCGV